MNVEVAQQLGPAFSALLGNDSSIAVHFWDESSIGPNDPKAAIYFNTPDALRRIFWAPSELGFSRAFVNGEIEITGDIFYALRTLGAQGEQVQLGTRSAVDAIRAAVRLRIIGRPIPAPPEEAKPRGRVHSKLRDQSAVSHHYDISNDFYELFLGETMAYSCARFTSPKLTLDEAQVAKFDLICRKLDLKPGMRLLDVGCGWGGMAIHAAKNYGVDVVGITVSSEQVQLAEKRVSDAGVADQVEIQLTDYRDVKGTFDAISSIGMFEHVGKAKAAEYFQTMFRLLKPEGRLLNHAISTRDGLVLSPKSFLYRYIFPDGELQDVGETILAMQRADFEVRDVENLREHYALTLREWIKQLEANWDTAVELVGLNRLRAWRLYMAGTAASFETPHELALHQVLCVRLGEDGSSGMPLTRASYV